MARNASYAVIFSLGSFAARRSELLTGSAVPPFDLAKLWDTQFFSECDVLLYPPNKAAA